MDKKEEFKAFVKENPFLIQYVRDGKKNWQDFYEMYDLYGEDEDAWGKLLNEESKSTTKSNNRSGYLEELVKMAKNVDVNKVQEGISSLQKTLGLFGELFASKEAGSNKKEYNPRPLYKRFED